MPAPAPPVRAPTKTEQIHARLRQEILSGALAPGAYLNIDELARLLGVSPIPVREAVARLASERFVVIRPHVGAEVAPVGRDSIHDVFALLEGLETAAAGRIVELAVTSDSAELEAALDTLDRALARGDRRQWADGNATFHLRLAAIARLPLVQDELALAYAHWERIQANYFAGRANPRLAAAQKEHRAMLGALKLRKAARLEHLLRDHNRTARDLYLGMVPS